LRTPHEFRNGNNLAPDIYVGRGTTNWHPNKSFGVSLLWAYAGTELGGVPTTMAGDMRPGHPVGVTMPYWWILR
jgi:hypothetical protein